MEENMLFNRTLSYLVNLILIIGSVVAMKKLIGQTAERGYQYSFPIVDKCLDTLIELTETGDFKSDLYAEAVRLRRWLKTEKISKNVFDVRKLEEIASNIPEVVLSLAYNPEFQENIVIIKELIHLFLIITTPYEHFFSVMENYSRMPGISTQATIISEQMNKTNTCFTKYYLVDTNSEPSLTTYYSSGHHQSVKYNSFYYPMPQFYETLAVTHQTLPEVAKMLAVIFYINCRDNGEECDSMIRAVYSNFERYSPLLICIIDSITSGIYWRSPAFCNFMDKYIEEYNSTELPLTEVAKGLYKANCDEDIYWI